jgi:hypothetical protein
MFFICALDYWLSLWVNVQFIQLFWPLLNPCSVNYNLYYYFSSSIWCSLWDISIYLVWKWWFLGHKVVIRGIKKGVQFRGLSFDISKIWHETIVSIQFCIVLDLTLWENKLLKKANQVLITVLKPGAFKMHKKKGCANFFAHF